MVPQPKCRYSFLFSEFLIIGPVPVALNHKPTTLPVNDERVVQVDEQRDLDVEQDRVEEEILELNHKP